MFYVYILQSINAPDKTYIGFTTNIVDRVAAHNNGQSMYTSHFKPWQLRTYMAFDSEQRARDFEKYLKSSSGKAFSHKRLM